MSQTNHNHKHHDHDHGRGHSHAPKVNANNRRRVGFAALLTGAFMIVEVIGGVLSGSLALLADAGHMMTDFAALAMAWGAFIIAQRPANWKHTFGYDRFAILIAFVNGLTLFLLAIWIIFESATRLLSPVEVLAGPMLYVAIAGLFINIVVFWILRGADQHNLNIRGAVLHVLGDMLGSAAAIIAAIVILLTGWTLADPLLSSLVAVLILRAALHLIKDSAHILLEGAPAGLDRREIAADLIANVEGLLAVEHIHIWSITRERPMVTLDAYVGEQTCLSAVNRAIKVRLAERFQIERATVDVMRRD